MKIAIIVPGRFHAFDLARELLKLGHDVTLFTNYPKFAAARFGVPPDKVRSFLIHGVLSRFFHILQRKCGLPYPEKWLHSIFGKWAMVRVCCEPWDVVQGWSGICEELFKRLKDSSAVLVCERGSTHISFQKKILEEEVRRIDRSLEVPSEWTVSREIREYDLADVVHVPSRFAKESFAREGFPADKVKVVLLGVESKKFRSLPAHAQERYDRILSGQSLRILNVGTFNFRKGVWDTAAVVRELAPEGFHFRFVGSVAFEARGLALELRSLAEFIDKKPQYELVEQYAWADLFILPTLEEGFPMVSLQAAASGLPILTTPNGAGFDLVRDSVTGWILPPRDPKSFTEKLRWCYVHRKELANMSMRTYSDFRPRDWSKVADDFIEACKESAALKKEQK